MFLLPNNSEMLLIYPYVFQCPTFVKKIPREFPQNLAKKTQLFDPRHDVVFNVFHATRTTPSMISGEKYLSNLREVK